MSKMPAKKKSCFQITSVTQAQVAAIGAADDTESLEDPDESRAEDVSSEIYDMSRPEYDPSCDRSSSEEALNNIGEQEAISVLAPSHIPQPSQLPLLSGNPVGSEFRKVAAPGLAQGMVIPPGSSLLTQAGATQQQQGPPAASAGTASGAANTSQPAVLPSSAPATATTTVSCTSRFRVIKLDHGIGEPFRRGRWTCTEFYEKDSEGSAAGRTADSTRHAGAAADPAADGGTGQTGGSVVAPSPPSGQGFGSGADASLSSPRMHLVDTATQQPVHPPPSSSRVQGVSGAFSSSKPAAVPAQPALGALQASAPHGVLSAGQNGLSQSGTHIQKSPIMPPSAQSMTYPLQQQQQQLPVGLHLSSQSDYYQQQQQASSVQAGQAQPASSLSAGPQSVGQGQPSGLSSTSGGASDVAGGGGGSVMFGQPAAGLLQQQQQQPGGLGGSSLTGSSAKAQQSGALYAAAAQPPPLSLHAASSSAQQNVPALAASSSVSTAAPTTVPSASSAVMPNVTASSLPPAHSKATPPPGSQGLSAVGFGHGESSEGAKPEGPANAQSPGGSGKEPLKPLMPESLQLSTPTVNSLFGIQIAVDGDADR